MSFQGVIAATGPKNESYVDGSVPQGMGRFPANFKSQVSESSIKGATSKGLDLHRPKAFEMNALVGPFATERAHSNTFQNMHLTDPTITDVLCSQETEIPIEESPEREAAKLRNRWAG